MGNGHFDRIVDARTAIRKTLKPGTAAFFMSDIDLSKAVGVSGPTLRKLRKELGIPAREDRILGVVASLGLAHLDDYLAKLPGVDYHCLYMLLRNRKITYLKRGGK